MTQMPLLLKSAVIGIAAPVVALLLTFMASTGGVRVNTDAWPPAAKAVLAERPGQPISQEQWARIDKTLREHGGDARPSHTAAAELRKVWPIAVIVLLVALGFARWRWKSLPLGASALVVAPTAVLLVAAFTHTHPHLP